MLKTLKTLWFGTKRQRAFSALTVFLPSAVFLGATVVPAGADYEVPSAPAPSSGLGDAARPWDLSTRAFIGHNDNVNLVPETTFFVGETDSLYTGLTVDGEYRYQVNEQLTIRPRMRFDQLWHKETQPMTPGPNDDANEYDLTVLHPSVTAEYSFQLANRPSTFNAGYDFRSEDAPISAIGLKSHALRAKMATMVCPDLELSAGYAHAADDYSVTFPDPDLNDRDAKRNIVTAGGKYWSNQRLSSIGLTYQFTDSDSEGSNFQYFSNGIIGRVESQLIGPLFGALQMGYSHYDYDGFISGFIPAPGRKEQDIYANSLQLVWVLTRNLQIDVYWNHKEYEANISQFNANVDDLGLGIMARF